MLSGGKSRFSHTIRFSIKISSFFAYFTLIVQCKPYLFVLCCVLPVLNLKLCLHGHQLSPVILARDKSM